MKLRSHFAVAISALALAIVAGPAAARAQITQTTFATPLNRVETTVLAGGHASGSGTLTVAAGKGSMFGTPSPTAPVRFSVTNATTKAVTIFKATGRTNDTLTGLTAVEGTADQTFAAGDALAVRVTAGTFADIHAAVNTLETAVAALQAGGGGGGGGNLTIPTGLLKGVGGALAIAQAGTEYLAPSGSGAALTGITQSQVANLTTDLGTITGAIQAHTTALAGKLSAASNLSDLGNAAAARSNLGLGTMATQGAGAVSITGGTLSGTHSGDGSGLTGITEGQVANLTTDLAAQTTALAGKAALRSDGTVAPGVIPFAGLNPAKASNLLAAWEADNLALADGAQVTSWPDSGSGGFNLATGVGTATYQAASLETGRPAVRFPGSATLTNATIAGNFNSFCAIAVVTPESRAVNQVVMGLNNSPLYGLNITSGQLNVFISGGSPGAAQFDYRYATNSPGVVAMTARSNGTNWTIGTNGQEYTLATPIASSNAWTGVALGGYYTGGSNFTGLVHAVYLFNSPPTATQVEQYTRYLHAKHATRLRLDVRRPSILFDSNSLGQGFQASKNSREPFEIAMDSIGRGSVDYRNVSSSGMKSQTIASRISTVTGPMVAGSQKALVHVWDGTNDTTQANITSSHTTWVAQGKDVLAGTSISRAAIDATLLSTNNPWLRGAWKTQGCAGLVDYAQHWRFGALGSYANTTYYNADQTHLTDAGYELLGRIFYNNWLVYQFPNGGGPDPQLPGYTTNATPTTIKSWFPTGGDGVYLLRVDAACNRVDAGTEDAAFAGGLYKLRVASGVLTVTQITAPTATYNTLSTATIGVVQSALGTGGFDIQATGEASKGLAWRFTLKLTATN